MRYERTAVTQADPDTVWRAVSGLEQWPEWTASMDRVDVLEPPVRVGTRVRVRQPKLRPAVYTVEDWQPGQGFVWSTTSPGVRITAGHHVATEAAGEQRLRLTVQVSGPLAPVVSALLGARIRRYVDLETDGLRRYAEHLQSSGDHS